MKNMEESDLRKLICEIVEECSGGVKFTELVTKLVIKTNFNFNYTPDEVELIVRNTEGIRILDYTWCSLNRSKMFVYTP